MGSFAPFSTLEEVIERANDSLYGLAAGVWSRNINTCMAVAEGVSRHDILAAIWVAFFSRWQRGRWHLAFFSRWQRSCCG